MPQTTQNEVPITREQLNWVLRSMTVARILLTADASTPKYILLQKMRQAREAFSKAETFINNKYLGRETANTGQFND